MDGSGQFLSSHRWARELDLIRRGRHVALYLRHHHRRDIWAVVPTRHSRRRLQRGMGLGYGMFWWFLGPLTLLPLLQDAPINWSYAHGAELFGSFIGHIVYGIIVGLLYAALDRLWVRCFIESDTLKRAPEGAGARTLRSLSWGAIASLIGGMLFSLIMASTGALSRIAGIVDSSSPALGFVIHLLISLPLGISYGVLFH